MKIHGIVYLIVGGLVIGGIKYLSTVDDNIDIAKFTIIIWIAYAFIAIGFFKVITSLILTKSSKISKENFSHHREKNIQTQNQPSAGVKYCTSCGAVLRSFDKFCYKCGSRRFHG